MSVTEAIAAAVDEDRLVATATELVAIPSPTGNELEAAEYLSRHPPVEGAQQVVFGALGQVFGRVAHHRVEYNVCGGAEDEKRNWCTIWCTKSRVPRLSLDLAIRPLSRCQPANHRFSLPRQ